MTNKVINSFENAIDKLVAVFNKEQNNYFFTEKELHSYFYHLCLESNLSHRNYNLIHTEYPTPFKCKNIDTTPYIKIVKKEAKNQRAHIDLILLNPNLIDYLLQNRPSDYFKFISGIGEQLFSKYIDEFYEIYTEFSEKYNESILLYAIEFKYHRHSYSGTKYPKKDLIRDIHKLKLINQFESMKNIPFCQNIKSLVFIGNRISESAIDVLSKVANENKEICSIYIKHKA
jgi:hypothetical protein